MSLQTDNYLGFTYRGKTLGMKENADFTGFIENSGSDLQFFNTPDFTNEFVEMQFGERTFYRGNTKSNRSFDLNLQLDKITLTEYKEFLEWLNLDDKGFLVFDYNPDYGFEVKVNSISNSEFHVMKEENCDDKYYINLSIGFITVNDFASIWRETYEEKVFFPIPDPNTNDITLIDNEKDLNFIQDEGDDEYIIFNHHNLKNYFVIEFDNTLSIQTTDATPISLVTVTGAGTGAKYFSEFGIALKADGTFVSVGDSNPLITIDANSSKTLEITGTISKIIPTSREIL